jgi:hypothetical protein
LYSNSTVVQFFWLAVISGVSTDSFSKVWWSQVQALPPYTFILANKTQTTNQNHVHTAKTVFLLEEFGVNLIQPIYINIFDVDFNSWCKENVHILSRDSINRLTIPHFGACPKLGPGFQRHISFFNHRSERWLFVLLIFAYWVSDFPILSSFMTYHRICNKINTTGVTSGAGAAYSYGAPEFTPGL